MRKVLPLLAATVALGTAAPALALDASDREAIRAEVEALLLENPEIIIDALRKFDQMQQAKAAEAESLTIAQNQKALNDPEDTLILGNPDGDVTLVEFLDYRCGFCKRSHDQVNALVESDGNIRYVIKELPILGPDSVTASRAAIAAIRKGDQDRATALHNAMMSFKGSLTDGAIYKIAREIGFDLDDLEEEMKSDAVTTMIQDNYALASALSINGTPAFVVGDQVLHGAQSDAALTAALDAARQDPS